MQGNTCYCTVLLLLTCFPAVFSERTCVLISVGQSWQYRLRSKIVDKCKEILGIILLPLLPTCTPIVYFQSVPLCSSLLDIVDQDIDSVVRLLTNEKKYLVLYSYHCYLHLFQLFFFRTYPHAHLSHKMLTER